MPDLLMQLPTDLFHLHAHAMLASIFLDAFNAVKPWVLIVLGFSAVIFVHELGHFAMAKWAGVKVDKFCIGFGRELFGFTRGETRYGFNVLPLGGYVKMLGQEDFEVDTTGELQAKEDPRSFANKPVGHRMLIVSAGVVMNILFAALLFMIVFLVGVDVVVTEVGFVKPNSPAALGGLQAGDDIKAINGRKVNEFSEVTMAIILSEPHEPLEFQVDRNGEIKHLKVLPENSEEKNVLMVGISPALTRDIVMLAPGADPEREDVAKPGDKIVEINGREVNDENANEMIFAMLADMGHAPKVVVERPTDPDNPDSPTTRVNIEVTPTLQLYPSDPTDSATANVLGFSPLMRFDRVDPDGRAFLAGIKPGDTILKIGDVQYPTGRQIAQTIRQSCTERYGQGKDDYQYVERDIPMVVRGVDGAERHIVMRPKVRGSFFGPGSLPEIGATFNLIASDVMRIGEVVPDVMGKPTPAAVAGVPAGSMLKSIDGEPINDWIALVEAFRTHAGQTVTLQYTGPDDTNREAQLSIPHSLRTKMGLPVASDILSINGDETVRTKVRDREMTVAVGNWYGLRAKLSELVGQTATVRFARGRFDEPETAEVAITADMIDPWLGRVGFDPNLIVPGQATKLFRTANPLTGIGIGVKKTWYFVEQVYSTMRRMIFTRTVGVETLSGPVGIAKIGKDFASVGVVQLLFFLAVISANLAVINFLPLPIVDGGLMVFLIIEKIKGTPVSIKTQVATQMIGLVLIIAAFVFVTIQDLQRIFG